MGSALLLVLALGAFVARNGAALFTGILGLAFAGAGGWWLWRSASRHPRYHAADG